MKKVYAIPVLLFLMFYGCAAIIHITTSGLFENSEYGSLPSSLLFILLSALCIVFFKLEIKIFKNLLPSSEIMFLVIILAILFFINNYLAVNFSETNHYSEIYKTSNPFFYLLIYFPLSGMHEEFLYRGFIQNHINTKSTNVYINKYISKGNLLASSLMLIAHLGFFAIMEVSFALSSLLLVLIFSLTIGYIFDKTRNLLLVSIIHFSINYIHYFLFLMI